MQGNQVIEALDQRQQSGRRRVILAQIGLRIDQDSAPGRDSRHAGLCIPGVGLPAL